MYVILQLQHSVGDVSNSTSSTVQSLTELVVFLFSACLTLMIFFLSSVCDVLTHCELLHELSALALFRGYVSWLRSYVTNRKILVYIFDVFRHLLWCLQEPSKYFTVKRLLFNIFVTDVCNYVKYSYRLRIAPCCNRESTARNVGVQLMY